MMYCMLHCMLSCMLHFLLPCMLYCQLYCMLSCCLNCLWEPWQFCCPVCCTAHCPVCCTACCPVCCVVLWPLACTAHAGVFSGVVWAVYGRCRRRCDRVLYPTRQCLAIPCHGGHSPSNNSVFQDHDGAEAEFREAIRIDPEHADAHYSLGVLLDNVRKDYDGAEREYREVRIDMCRRVYRRVYRHVDRQLYRHVCRRFYRHVRRRVYRRVYSETCV